MGHAKHWKGTGLLGTGLLSTGVWVGILLACTCGASSCTPGELDAKQEKYLRNEVKKRYPAPKPEVKEDAAADDTNEVEPDDDDDSEVSSDTDDESTDDESTSEETSDVATSEETSSSAPAETSEPPDMTSETADAGGGSSGEIPDCFMQMVTTTCSGSACHYGGDFNFPPNFETESLFELLTTTGSTCSGANSSVYIDLENPQDSYLIQKIKGEGCSTPMPPPGEGEISDAELECLEGWLDSL